MSFSSVAARTFVNAPFRASTGPHLIIAEQGIDAFLPLFAFSGCVTKARTASKNRTVPIRLSNQYSALMSLAVIGVAVTGKTIVMLLGGASCRNKLGCFTLWYTLKY